MSITSLPLLNVTQRAQHYLQRKDFGITMLVVAGLHVFVILAILLWPKPDVTQIPVRTLDITLGAPEAAKTHIKAAPKTLAPTAKSKPDAKITTNAPESFSSPAEVKKPPKTKPITKKPAPKKKTAEKRVKISDKRRAPKQQTIPANIPSKVALPTPPARRALPPSNTAPTDQLNLSASPHQYVRSSTNNGTAKKSISPAEEESIRARYEQKISGWLEQNRVSSAKAQRLGQHGTVIMRVRLDRRGTVRYYAVDRSSGFQLIDEAALQMVRRANPFPAAPANYPGGNFMEFLIPVKFAIR